jgi:hypothetical protein
LPKHHPVSVSGMLSARTQRGHGMIHISLLALNLMLMKFLFLMFEYEPLISSEIHLSLGLL